MRRMFALFRLTYDGCRSDGGGLTTGVSAGSFIPSMAERGIRLNMCRAMCRHGLPWVLEVYGVSVGLRTATTFTLTGEARASRRIYAGAVAFLEVVEVEAEGERRLRGWAR